MIPLLRVTLFILFCGLAAAAGWWLHTPPPFLERPALTEAPSQNGGPAPTAIDDESINQRIAAIDPFGLKRTAPLSPTIAGSPAAAASTEAIAWRVGALVVRGNERYLLLTSPGQTPMRVSEGEKLPDGDRIKAIRTDHVVIQSARGRTRTIYLTEP